MNPSTRKTELAPYDALHLRRSWVIRVGFLLLALRGLALPQLCVADSGPTTIAISPLGTNSDGKLQFELSWNSAPGAIYKLQNRETLSPSTRSLNSHSIRTSWK